MPQINGPLHHNSYVVTKLSQAQFDAPMIPQPTTPVDVDAVKWAKGTLTINSGSTTTGKLVFAVSPPMTVGPSLDIDFSFETFNGQTVFKGLGIGKTGPLTGVNYQLLGWAKLDTAGAVTEIEGGILAVSGATANPLVG